jgi:hypothetical protein
MKKSAYYDPHIIRRQSNTHRLRYSSIRSLSIMPHSPPGSSKVAATVKSKTSSFMISIDFNTVVFRMSFYIKLYLNMYLGSLFTKHTPPNTYSGRLTVIILLVHLSPLPYSLHVTFLIIQSIQSAKI